MPKPILTDKDLSTIDKRLTDITGYLQEIERAEQCGMDCTAFRERAQWTQDFFRNVKAVYFPNGPTGV